MVNGGAANENDGNANTVIIRVTKTETSLAYSRFILHQNSTKSREKLVSIKSFPEENMPLYGTGRATSFANDVVETLTIHLKGIRRPGRGISLPLNLYLMDTPHFLF